MLSEPKAIKAPTVETYPKGGENQRTLYGRRENDRGRGGENYGGQGQERVEPTPVLEGIGCLFYEESLAGVRDGIVEVGRYIGFLE